MKKTLNLENTIQDLEKDLEKLQIEVQIPLATKVAKRLKETQDGFDTVFLRRCIQGLNETKSDSITVSTVGTDFSALKRVRTILESKGYKIDMGNDQREGTWFRIIVPMD